MDIFSFLCYAVYDLLSISCNFMEVYMPYQDTALVCLNGHMINDSINKNPELNTKFCEQCGEANISECPKCEAMIRGNIHYEHIIGGGLFDPPLYCHNCGEPYPWMSRRLDALKEAIMYTELDDSDKKIFTESIVDVTSENPKTKLSVLKIKNIGAKIGGSLWNDIISPLIVEIASETAKKAFGL